MLLLWSSWSAVQDCTLSPKNSATLFGVKWISIYFIYYLFKRGLPDYRCIPHLISHLFKSCQSSSRWRASIAAWIPPSCPILQVVVVKCFRLHTSSMDHTNVIVCFESILLLLFYYLCFVLLFHSRYVPVLTHDRPLLWNPFRPPLIVYCSSLLSKMSMHTS